MTDHPTLQEMEDAFATALRRTEELPGHAEVLPADVMANLREANSADEELAGSSNDRRVYKRARNVVRAVLSELSMMSVESVGADREAGVRRCYRFLTGPVWEMRHRLDEQSELSASPREVEQLRKETGVVSDVLSETVRLEGKAGLP